MILDIIQEGERIRGEQNVLLDSVIRLLRTFVPKMELGQLVVDNLSKPSREPTSLSATSQRFHAI